MIQALSPPMTPESAAAMIIYLYEAIMIRIRLEGTNSPYDFLTQILPDIIFVQ